MTTHVHSADGTTIGFTESGSGPVLILVDGASCYRDFGPLASLAGLLAADFAVYTYDRRGRGESTDTPPYAIEREVEDLAALIEEAGGSAFLYGVSSGALLALHAAVALGPAIPKLALFEPPIGDDEDQVTQAAFTAELAELIAAGRPGDAVERFQTGIGVPPEMVAGMRQAPFWPALEAIAPTLIYDCTISAATTLDDVAAVKAPALVIDSEASSENLTGWAAAVVDALPNGTHRSLVGQWHSVPDEDLAPVLTEFLLG
ncbi:MAG TPA: alpha/beta hydrolase [Acidimicrobiales bacterium]|jgi:pimeloyl-ACP methyl ester carboxylesterase